MAKIREVYSKGDGTLIQHAFMCPGCKIEHFVSIEVHEFNGDFDKPSFKPSLVSKGRVNVAGHACHSYVTDGRIEFLVDCTHELVNQTVDLLDLSKVYEEDWEGDGP